MTTQQNEDKILNRIRKMLALAADQAATEHERDTALQMAFKLMAKYNLSMMDMDEHERQKQDPRDIYQQAGWSQIWAKHINNIMAELFFCRYFYGAKINATKCYHNFAGKESNATTAMLMSEFIIASILKECRRLYTHNLSSESRSFALGCVDKLRSRVKEMKAKAQIDAVPGSALVIVDLYKSEADANELILPKLNKSARGQAARHQDAYDVGNEFGAKINLSVQVGTALKTSTLQIK